MSHMGLPLNAAADEQADIGLAQDSGPSDTQPQALELAARRKTVKYQVILASLQPHVHAGWAVQLLCVWGSLHCWHWVPAVDAMHVSLSKHVELMHHAGGLQMFSQMSPHTRCDVECNTGRNRVRRQHT